MSKVFKTLFLFFIYFFGLISVFSSSWDLEIISRQEWWAIEEYRYLDSPEWENIIEKWNNAPKTVLNQYQINKAQIESEKVKKANNFLVSNYSNIIGLNSIKKEENWHKLAWPIAYSKVKTAIVVHHTDSDIWIWGDNHDAIRKIYKYHALTRAWWDIWYNYLIWTNWEIFEGRAWGDFSVWAHDKWNNQSTIWVSLIWNYQNNKASDKQMESLEKLIKFLERKYSINFNEKQDFFKWCVGTSLECQDKPLIIEKKYPLIGHKDAWHTACPWDKLYKQINDLKEDLKIGHQDDILSFKQKLLLKEIKSRVISIPEYKKLELLWKIELLLDKDNWGRAFLVSLKDIFIKPIKDEIIDDNIINNSVSFDENNRIKVKLSYPHSDNISFKLSKKLSLDYIKNEKEYKLNFVDLDKKFKNNHLIKYDFRNNKLFLNDKEFIDFTEIDFLRISVPENEVIEIYSWERKPKWDKTWKLNDNKFRGDIVLYSKDNELIVVNELYLNDYLKGLWEVSNSTSPEKIKTIIILARTYARWYMTKARKFAWEWFDASDDPNVFQKYLWFWLEQRSPKVNEIVETTKDLVVTYDWELIKPWYFSSSDGKTTSFLDYCKNAKWVPDCAHPERFPFLIWVSDNWWIWNEKAWHWVWVPWTWVQYFSERWWSFNMIIKYFLKWVEIEKKSN